MKVLLFLISSYCWIQGFAQTQQKGQEKDSIYVVLYGKDEPNLGFPNDGKISEGAYVNNRKEGVWIKYHPDGVTPKMIGNYQNNRPSGPFEKYYKTGKLKEKGRFTKNSYRDSLVRLFENGQIEYCAFYDSLGREKGLVLYFYPSGQLKTSYVAVNGVPHDVIELNENSDTILNYKNPPAPCIEYNLPKQLKTTERVNDTLNQIDVNGLKQGHWIYYGKDRPGSDTPINGKVEEGNYINGRKEGIWIKYFNDGVTPKTTGEYQYNRLVGPYNKTGIFQSIDTLVENPQKERLDEIIPTTPNPPNTKQKPFKPEEFNQVYTADQEIWLTGMFKNGQLFEGKIYDYDRDGILLKVRIIKDGKYCCDGKL